MDALVETSRNQLEKIKDHYRQLKIVHKNIRVERDELMAEKQEVKELQKQQKSEKFQLNVRGQTEGLVLSQDLLCSVQGSSLEAMFSGRHAIL